MVCALHASPRDHGGAQNLRAYLSYGTLLVVSGSGETGRHAALRWLWEKSCGGSSPLFRTMYRVVLDTA